jgi:hypothetical protein
MQDIPLEHPSETIIMSIKNERRVDAGDFRMALRPFLGDPVFYRQVDPSTRQPTIIDLNVPTLEEAKGSIVLFRRYNGDSGIDADTGWPYDEQTSAPTNGQVPMMIQDTFQFMSGQGEQKWDKVKSFLEQAKADASGTWWINFTSAAGGQTPRWFADKVNPLFQHWLDADTEAQRLGTIVMDFPSDPMIDFLITRNQLDIPGQLKELTGYQMQLARLVDGYPDAYIGDAYYYPGDQWNYVQVYEGTPPNRNHAIHTLHKVGGSSAPGIHVGDTVVIMSTQFKDDDFIYIAAPGRAECFYDSFVSPKYSENNIRWVIERSPSVSSEGTVIRENDPIRLRNLYWNRDGHPGYLLASTNKNYVWVAPTDDGTADGGYVGGFDWKFTLPQN